MQLEADNRGQKGQEPRVGAQRKVELDFRLEPLVPKPMSEKVGELGP